MLTKVVLFASIFSVYTSNAAVLLWSNNRLEISPLNTFTDENLEDLIRKLRYPELTVYKSTSALLPEFETLLDGYHTAYNPNGEISTENATEIAGRDDLSLLETKQQTDLSTGNNVLSILVLPSSRHKREATPVSSTTETSATPPKGPVLYRRKTNKNTYTLLYSSQPLVYKSLSFNSSVELGKSISVTIDTQNKNTSIRLDVSIPVGEEKYILQFSFKWQSAYWSLTTVKVKTTMSNNSVNLVISEAFRVPARFSYHCSGVTVFSDVEKTTELLIYDMQVQPDSKDGTFGDVYDCVDFTTVPIWSGLFVTSILAVGLIVALIAISEIKTMDKFDNQKTKQLAITVAE